MHVVEHWRRRADNNEYGSFRIDNADGDFVNHRNRCSNHDAVNHIFDIAGTDRPTGLWSVV